MKIKNAAGLEATAAAAPKPNPDLDTTPYPTNREIKSSTGMGRTIENTSRRQKLHGKDRIITSKHMNTPDFCCKSQPSARKIAATLWRARFSKMEIACDQKFYNPSPVQHRADREDFQLLCQHGVRLYNSESKEDIKSPFSPQSEKQLVTKFSTAEMEGATKWDTSIDLSEEQNSSLPKNKANPPSPSPLLSSLWYELGLAKTRIQELEAEKHNLRKNTDIFVHKVANEEAIWRSRTRTAITALKSDLDREKKAHHRLSLVNSKLSADLSSVNLSMKRLLHDYDKEKKAKEMMEQVCDELAREMGDDKAEIESIKRDSIRLQEEVEEERKMVQMAELWREEQIQMKLADARLILHEKYDRLSHLIYNMESFLRKGSYTAEESREAETLIRTASSVAVPSVEDFSYTPPSTAEMLSALQHGPVEKDIEPSPRADRILPTTAEGCKEVGSNISGRSTSVSVIVEESNQVRQSKKKGSLSRLWRTGQKEVVNGRISSSSTGSVERSAVEAESGSPESGNSNVSSRAMKGCLEWPCNAAHRSSAKVKLLGIGGDMSRIQLKHVVNQKM